MFRRAIVVVVVVSRVGLCTSGSVAAPRKSEKSNAVRDAVEKVLRREQTSQLDRRAELRDDLARYPDSNELRWSAGYVRDGNAWRPVEEIGPSAASDEMLISYAERRSRSSETADGQLDLANWCRQNKLRDRERVHLLAALELAPLKDHPAILERLGYWQFGDQWLSDTDIRQWQAANRSVIAAVKHWRARLEKIAERLDGSQRQQEIGLTSLRQLSEPDIIPALEYLWCGRSETCALAAIDSFAKLEGCEATLALARQAVFSSWLPVRQRAADHLKTRRFEDFVPPLMGLVVGPAAFRISTQLQYFPDGKRSATAGAFVLVTNLILARETEDQFQEAVTRTVDYRLNEIIGYSPLMQRFNVISWGLPTSGFVKLAQERAATDSARLDAAADFNREKLAEAMNDRAAELNNRVIGLLATVSGRDPSPDPAAWWQWWAGFTDTQLIGGKQVVTVAEDTQVLGDPTRRIRVGSCFVAGTPVWTETGQEAIEKIRIGDRVLAQDVDSGELSYKPVLRATIRPRRELVRVRIGDETIMATGGHRFWISGDGWIKARDLAPPSLAHTVMGNALVGSVGKGPAEETHNLVVADFHNYFVGRAGILVQDLPLPQPTNVVVPGLARK